MGNRRYSHALAYPPENNRTHNKPNRKTRRFTAIALLAAGARRSEGHDGFYASS